MTAMAAIAARTERIRMGSFVMLMPFQDPLRIAEDGACGQLVQRTLGAWSGTGLPDR